MVQFLVNDDFMKDWKKMAFFGFQVHKLERDITFLFFDCNRFASRLYFVAEILKVYKKVCLSIREFRSKMIEGSRPFIFSNYLKTFENFTFSIS